MESYANQDYKFFVGSNMLIWRSYKWNNKLHSTMERIKKNSMPCIQFVSHAKVTMTCKATTEIRYIFLFLVYFINVFLQDGINDSCKITTQNMYFQTIRLRNVLRTYCLFFVRRFASLKIG